MCGYRVVHRVLNLRDGDIQRALGRRVEGIIRHVKRDGRHFAVPVGNRHKGVSAIGAQDKGAFIGNNDAIARLECSCDSRNLEIGHV
ncbi:hypothetical protein D3C75_683350 [compost metagenome]